MTPKILILYAYFESPDAARNLSFFCRHAITPDLHRSHMIVVNGECSVFDVVPRFENVRVLTRENKGFDFGAWAHALSHVETGEFDYFFFMNSSVTGPFLPAHQEVSSWPEVFTALLDDRVKLAGLTINVLGGAPHVQSMFLATDRAGLKLLAEGGIFTDNASDASKHDVIARRELAASKIIIEAGFAVDCLAAGHHRRSLRSLRRNGSGDIVYPSAYLLGHTLEPQDTVFFKTNRGCSPWGLERAVQLADYKRVHAAERCFQDPRTLHAVDTLKCVPSAWRGHVELAIWLTCRFLPQVVVDLGVDFGVSTYAWGASGLAQVVGIDWFQGDAHAGFRDTQVNVLALGDKLAGRGIPTRNVRIWKSSFDAAADQFDRQVDILHLDGLHTHEAVTKDLKSWLPKLRDGGLLVMHDIRAYRDSVGAIFDELPLYKVAFDHSAGLGVASSDADKIAIVDREWRQMLLPSSGGLIHQDFDHLRISG